MTLHIGGHTELFVGIDPGINNLGLCAIDYKARVVLTHVVKDPTPKSRRKKQLTPERQMLLVCGALDKIESLKCPDSYYALEQPFRPLSLHSVFHGLQFALQQLVHPESRRLKIVSSSALKSFVGAKSKEHVALAVYKRWGFEHISLDIVDAYALAQYARHEAMQPENDG